MRAITNLGDLALTLGEAALLFLWLLIAAASSLAWRWVAALALAGLALFVTKELPLFFPLSWIRLETPSGHVATSVLVYGAFGLVVACGLAGWRRAFAIGAAAGLVALIAVSRVHLRAHTPAEVVVGLAIGLASLLWFGRGYLRRIPSPTRWRGLAVTAPVLGFALYGTRLDIERLIKPAPLLGWVCGASLPGRAASHAPAMDLAEFKRSLSSPRPPPGLGLAAAALWWDGKGNWSRAHQCIRAQQDPIAEWAHAYLHRKNGHVREAETLYRLAGRSPLAGPASEEWETIAKAALGGAR